MGFSFFKNCLVGSLKIKMHLFNFHFYNIFLGICSFAFQKIGFLEWLDRKLLDEAKCLVWFGFLKKKKKIKLHMSLLDKARIIQ